MIKEAEVTKDLLEFHIIDLKNSINNPILPATAGQIHLYSRGQQLMTQITGIIDKKKKEAQEDSEHLLAFQAEEDSWKRVVEEE